MAVALTHHVYQCTLNRFLSTSYSAGGSFTGFTCQPVDLVGITTHGVTKTNYPLEAGDKLFIQAKPSK